MKKLFSALMVLIFSMSMVFAQDLNAPINPDPNVKIGKLANGMTYYIRANKKPENRVEFRLAVNAGSCQENEDQRGLAHFTEHMAFNGIKGYPHNTMISELQKIGVTFGVGINAYTSFEETVYEITMPTDKPEYIQMGLDILNGWANGLLYDGDEIESERGIIAEEYRMGLGASDRMQKKWFPVLFQGSRYAERVPIGLIEIINGFKHQTIKDFYKDWYRPDLQAVIVVGDIDVDAMEKQIIKQFSKIKPVKNPREKLPNNIQPNKEPLAVVTTDKEAMGNQVLIVRKFPHFVMKTVGDYRTNLMYELYNTMYDSRLSEMTQKASCPFLSASCGYGELIGNTDMYGCQMACKENKIIESIEAMMREDQRVLQYGFLQTELNRAKEELLNNYEVAANEVKKTESSRFAREYVANYLHQDPIPGAKREYAYAKKYLDDITLEEVNALAKKWITDENLVAIVMAPDKEGVKVPTEKDVLAAVTNPGNKHVEPYVDTYKDKEVVEKDQLKAGSIVNTKEITEIDAQELTLNNGITVVLKKTDFKNDQILFNARSKGGMSLYYECDIPALHFACDFVDRAGISDLDYSSLEKKMKGKKVGVSPYINLFGEGLSGSSTPKDMEFFFQYIHAFFTSPRRDSTVAELVTSEYLEQIKMLDANPMYKFILGFMDMTTQNDPYQKQLMSEEEVKAVDYNRAFQLYEQRFANPADFIFTFVGNFDENLIKEYIELYLGSLQTTSEKETPKYEVVKDFPDKQIIETIYAGEEEQSWVGIAYEHDMKWTPKNTMIVQEINEALQIELIATIREKMSGVYSPMLQMSPDREPKPSYSMMIMFSCSPDNTDKLSEAVFNILKDFTEKGPSAETLGKVKNQMINDHQTSLKQNNMWLSYISSKYQSGEDINSINTYEERVNAITIEDIVKFMKENFDIDKYVKVYLYPEKMKK